jgi:uncharacterized membrane protein YeaQ/YmgE (transglycosylase-associated protein family)
VLALLVSWILGGLIVGGLGRLLVPGHTRMGIGVTILIGIAGSFLGGLVGTALGVGLLIRFVLAVAGSALIVAITHGHRHYSRRGMLP